MSLFPLPWRMVAPSERSCFGASEDVSRVYSIAQGCYSSPGSRSTPLSPPMQVSLWMQRWQQRLSTWLHVSLSQQILRLYRPAGILSAGL